MKNYHQPSGLDSGLDFLISTDWTPEQAWAVVELLDDLRDKILRHYLVPIQELLREERGMTGDLQEALSNLDDRKGLSLPCHLSLSLYGLTSFACSANGSNSSIRLLGQVGNFSKVSRSHAAGSIPLSFAVPSRV